MVSALVCSLVLAAPATYDLGLRTELRGNPEGNAELQLNPTLTLEAPLSRFSLLASYTPRMILFEPNAKTLSYLHRGHVAGTWRPVKGTRLVLDQQVLYGDISFSWLSVAAEGGAPTFDRLVQLAPLRYFNTSTSLGIEQALSTRVGVGLSAAYLVSGGADATARATAPIQRGPRASFRLVWSLGTRDVVTTSVDGYLASYSSTQRSYVADTNASWRHQLSRVTDFDIGAGAAVGREVTADSTSTSFYPYAGAGIRRGILEKKGRQYLTGSLRVRLAPAIDPLTGIVYARADAFATLDYSPVPKLTFSAAGGGSRALSSSLRDTTLGFGSVGAAYELNRYLTVATGLRGVWLPNFQWASFLAISVGEHGHF